MTKRDHSPAAVVEQWDGRGKGSALGNRFFMSLIRLAGVFPAYAMLYPACLGYVLFDHNSRRAHRQLWQRLGLRPGFFTFYRHIYSFGMSLVDRFAFLLLDKTPFSYECIGEDLIVSEAARGRGVILLGGHVGNWELAGNLLSDRLGAPVNVVLLDAEREALQRIYRNAIDNRSFHVIGVSPGAPDAAIEVTNRLRAGEIVCMLGDRTAGGRSVAVPFLGAPARFAVGPFAVAAVTGAPILPVFIVKTGMKRFRFFSRKPVSVASHSRNTRQAAIEQAAALFASQVEAVVREYPSQWYNFFDFWA